MADLFGKPGATSFGQHTARGAASGGLDRLHENDPLSAHFNSHCHRPSDLVRYMIAVQVSRYGRSIDLPPKVLGKHLTKLAGTWTLDVVARSICYAAQVSMFPFSTKFLSDRIIPEILERCRSFLTKTQETTNLVTSKTGS